MKRTLLLSAFILLFAGVALSSSDEAHPWGENICFEVTVSEAIVPDLPATLSAEEFDQWLARGWLRPEPKERAIAPDQSRWHWVIYPCGHPGDYCLECREGAGIRSCNRMDAQL